MRHNEVGLVQLADLIPVMPGFCPARLGFKRLNVMPDLGDRLFPVDEKSSKHQKQNDSNDCWVQYVCDLHIFKLFEFQMSIIIDRLSKKIIPHLYKKEKPDVETADLLCSKGLKIKRIVEWASYSLA